METKSQTILIAVGVAVILGTLVCACLAVVVVFFFGIGMPVQGNVFSNIIQSLPTPTP